MEPCKNKEHNLVVVAWKITEHARVARQFMCSHCFQLMDYDTVVEWNHKKASQKDV